MEKKLTDQRAMENKIVNKLSSVSIFGNIALTVFKLFAGTMGHSGAMLSDAIHSLSDVFTTVVAFIGVKMSKKEPDKEHPYGHDRLESIASIFLAIILIATGIGIGFSGIEKIVDMKKGTRGKLLFSCVKTSVIFTLNSINIKYIPLKGYWE